MPIRHGCLLGMLGGWVLSPASVSRVGLGALIGLCLGALYVIGTRALARL